MESMEMPVQMTTNVSTSIGNSVPKSSETIEMEVAPSNILQNRSGENIQEDIEEVTIANKLLNSAKDDGFEEALIKLANGELEVGNENNEPEVLDSDDSPEEFKPEEMLPEEMKPFHEQIVLLEEKVADLEEKNKELLERAKNSEKTNQVNQEIMLALAMALHELAKREEDEEKKISMLELIVNMLTYFMRETMTDYSEVEEKKSEGHTHQKFSSRNKIDGVGRIMQLINEKGQGLRNQPLQSPASQIPHIEKVAA